MMSSWEFPVEAGSASWPLYPRTYTLGSGNERVCPERDTETGCAYETKIFFLTCQEAPVNVVWANTPYLGK